jgi:transcriptional regulator with XRE-family HTH domain
VENKTASGDRRAFGDVIRQRRYDLGLTQGDLSERCDLHRTYISELERGIRNPSLQNIEKLAEALELTVVELFKLYEKEKS